MNLRERLIKIGAYIVLVFGIISTLCLLTIGVILFSAYPDASLQKKAVIGAIFVIAAFVVILLAISIFESMMALVMVEREVMELEEEIEHKS